MTRAPHPKKKKRKKERKGREEIGWAQFGE